MNILRAWRWIDCSVSATTEYYFNCLNF